MTSMDYDLDSNGGLMSQILALTAPPGSRDRSESSGVVVAAAEASSSLSAHPYFKRPGRGHNRDCCDACGEGGDLICCDICPASFHLICHDPPLYEEDIPLGEWGCHQCKVTQGDDDRISGTGRNSNGASSKYNRGVKRKDRDDDKICSKTDVKTANNTSTNSSSSLSTKQSDGKIHPGNGGSNSVNKANESKMNNSSGSSDSVDVSSTSEGTSVGTGVLKVIVSGREMELTDTPFLSLVRQAVITNPKQFVLPSDFSVPIAFPGESKAPLRINGRRVANSKKKPSHEKDNGLVPLPAKLCFTCNKSCRVGPLLACDYCPLLFHLDCLDPPLTTAPTHRWMCPNHPEHFLDQHLLTSCRVTERVRLWERCRGLVDQAAVQRSFFNRCHRPNPLRRFKLNKVLRSTIRVPEAIKEAYRNRSEKLPPLPPAHLRAPLSPELPPEYLASLALAKMSANSIKAPSPLPSKIAQTEENSVNLGETSRSLSEDGDRGDIDAQMDCSDRLTPKSNGDKSRSAITSSACVRTSSKGACCDNDDDALTFTGPDSDALTAVFKSVSESATETRSAKKKQVDKDDRQDLNHKHVTEDEIMLHSVALRGKVMSPSSLTPSDPEEDTTEDENLMHSSIPPSSHLTTRVGGGDTAPPPSSRGNFRGGGGGGSGRKSALEAEIDELSSRRMMGGISAMAVAAMAVLAEGNNKGDTTSDESEDRTDDEELEDTARKTSEEKTDDDDEEEQSLGGDEGERRKRRMSDGSEESGDLCNDRKDDTEQRNTRTGQVESTVVRRERTDGEREFDDGVGPRKRFKAGVEDEEAWNKECTVKQCDLKGEKVVMESLKYKRDLNDGICQSNGDISNERNWDPHQRDCSERFENNNKISSKNNEKCAAKFRLMSSDSAEELVITRDGETGNNLITKGNAAHNQSTPVHNSSSEAMDITNVEPISPVTSNDGRNHYNLDDVDGRPTETKTTGSVSPSSIATSSLEDSTMSGDGSAVCNVTVIDTRDKTEASGHSTPTITTTATSNIISVSSTTANQRISSIHSSKAAGDKPVTNCAAAVGSSGGGAAVTKFTVIAGQTLKHPSLGAFTEVTSPLNPDWPSPIMDISDDSSASERLFVQEEGSEGSSLTGRRPSAEVYGAAVSPLAVAPGTSGASATPVSYTGGGSRCTVYSTHVPNPGTMLYHSTDPSNNNNTNNMIRNDCSIKQNRTLITTSNKAFTVLNRTYSNNHVISNTFHPNNVSFSKPNHFVTNCPKTLPPVISKQISSIPSTESAQEYYNAQYNAVAQINNSNNQLTNEVFVNQPPNLSVVHSMSSNCNRQYRSNTDTSVPPQTLHGSQQHLQSQYQNTIYSSNSGSSSSSNSNWGQPWSSFSNNKQAPSAVNTHYSSSAYLPPASQETSCSLGAAPSSLIEVTDIKPEPSDVNLASCTTASQPQDADDDFKPAMPTPEERDAWLSSLVSFQASVAKHMMRPELPSNSAKTVTVPQPIASSQSTSASSSSRRVGSADQGTTCLPPVSSQQPSRFSLSLLKPSLPHQTASSSTVSSRPLPSSPPPAPPPPPTSMRTGRKQVLIPRTSPTGSCSSFLTSSSSSGASKPAPPPRTPAKSYLAR